jgi:3-dehydroquinate synthase
MNIITVTASRTYDIVIKAGLLNSAGTMIAAEYKDRSACVVTDDHVNPLYSERLIVALADAGIKSVCFVIKNGEASKNAENYIALLNFLAREQFTRGDVVIALGGGVVGDLAGFAASTYLRGIGFIQIPTTLLACVDSSVGGKTAIDLDAGKNLAGTFYQPSLVLCDIKLLETLPESVFTDGLAEVIKYGVIADRELLDLIGGPPQGNFEDIIARCVSIKRDIVAIDEFETGPRKLLNFGHTIGHAIEACSDYTISHGSAVAIGMAVISRASAKLGLCSDETALAIVETIHNAGLPVMTTFTAAELACAALNDKKRSGGSITLVIPETLGKAELHTVPVHDLENIIRLGLADSV